jgi:protein ImuB
MSTADAPRLLVLWCPDWPVVAATAAAGLDVTTPAAVFSGNRVVACSAQARASGVRRGMRRRDAQSHCPALAVLAHDPHRDGRLFEAVAAAVEELAVGVEVVRPGVVAVPVGGASAYHGSEAALAELLVDHVSAAAGVESQVGISDGLFAATLAARRGTIVTPGTTAEFLAPVPVTELDQPGTDRAELVGLLVRLGIRTLGGFAALTERDVASRFDRDAILAHRLARGLSERPPLRRRPPAELSVSTVFDPPLERVDAAAFAAKTLGEQLHARLAGHGLACTRLAILATTERAQTYTRVWRTAEPLTAQGIADRVRWQCEGWLTRAPEHRPDGGIDTLRLEPEETVSGGSLQLALPTVGRDSDADDRAGRALLRVQGLLGPDSVFTAALGGGRGPTERIRLIPWGDPRVPAADPDAPWPGRLPAPSPATVPAKPWVAVVRGAGGAPVTLTERHVLSEPPETVAVADRAARRVLRWAGPWPAQDPWWVRGGSTRIARIQVVLAEAAEGAGETALLLRGEVQNHDLQWTVEGLYD